MSETAADDIERLVEKQARGEPPGVPVEEGSFGAAQLDTRRSKSGLSSTLLSQEVTHVDVTGAEVDSQPYILQQTGALAHGAPPDTLPHQTPPAAPITVAGREVDVAYADIVDRPEYIQAHLQPGVGAPSEVALTANLQPDPVVSPGALESGQYLGEESTHETEIHTENQPA